MPDGFGLDPAWDALPETWRPYFAAAILATVLLCALFSLLRPILKADNPSSDPTRGLTTALIAVADRQAELEASARDAVAKAVEAEAGSAQVRADLTHILDAAQEATEDDFTAPPDWRPRLWTAINTARRRLDP